MAVRPHIQLQPAYVLHRRAYRDTSALIELFTPEFGRFTVIAKGVSRAKSRWQGVLQPYIPLLVSCVGRGELLTLSVAEIQGKPMHIPAYLYASGFYLNELLMRLLHRHEAYVELFSHYDQCLRKFSALLDEAQHKLDLQINLRYFELQLLNSLGYGLNLTHEAHSDVAIDIKQNYYYELRSGPIPVSAAIDSQAQAICISGANLQALAEQKLPHSLVDLKQVKGLMRAAIDSHLGDKPLHSRQMFLSR